MSDDTNEEVINEVVAEAKATFNLRDRLQGRNLREASVTLYTDDVLGEKLGDVGVPEEKLFNIVTQVGIEPSGVLGELHKLGDADDDTADDTKKRKALEKQKAAILAELDATALTVTLRAVPPVIIKGARRQAKVALGIKGKGIPDEMQESFDEEQEKNFLHSALVSIRDHASDTVISSPTEEDAQALADLLPRSEYNRLSAKLSDVLFKNTIAESVTAQVDFSADI